MKIELFNSAIVRAPGRLICQRESWQRVDVPVRFGLIKHDNGKYWLVDTGYGPRVTNGPRSTALRLYNWILGPILVEDSSPRAALALFGARPADVEAVIVTHFHADHVARLEEFPQARIVAHGAAARAVLAMSGRQAQRHGVFKELLPSDMEQRLDPIEHKAIRNAHPTLGDGYDLLGDGSLLAIDLPGHANGHFGLFWRGEDGPMLYATDTAWSMKALLEDKTPAISRAVVFDDPKAGMLSEEKARRFVSAGGKLQLCHDWDVG